MPLAEVTTLAGTIIAAKNAHWSGVGVNVLAWVRRLEVLSSSLRRLLPPSPASGLYGPFLDGMKHSLGETERHSLGADTFRFTERAQRKSPRRGRKERSD